MAVSVVFLVLHGCSTGAPSAGCGFPYPISSPTGTRTQLSFCSIRWPYITFKLPRGDIDTPPQFLPMSRDRDASLPLSVWSSSNGNNCHAVQRSLSSGASVWEYNGIFFFFFFFFFFFYLIPFHQSISAHATSSHNCHNPNPSPWIAFLAGSKHKSNTAIQLQMMLTYCQNFLP